MSSTANDALVIGAGWDGLAAALALARAGRRVVLLERRDRVGGIAAGEEFHPGYTAPGLALPPVRHHPELDPVLADLPRADAPVFLPERGGPGRTRPLADGGGPPAGLGAADRAAHERWGAWIAEVRDIVLDVLARPAPDLRGAGLADLWPLARSAWRARRLGARTLLEYARTAPMSAADLLDEWFEDSLWKAGLCAPALAGTFCGPRSPGTATNLLLWECAAARPAVGGPAAITRALEGAACAAGVTIRTACEVTGLRREGDAVAGVELSGGETLEAGVVVATCDPRRVLLELLPAPLRPAALGRELEGFRQRGTTAILNLALRAPLELAGQPAEGFSSATIGADLVELERAFDAVKYRRCSETPWLAVRQPSTTDASLAPEGGAVVQIEVHCAPHDLEGGWTEAARAALREAVLARLEPFAPGLHDRLVASELLAPPDLAERFALGGGHLFQGELALDQLGPLRPGSTCARGATPVPGLFLAGRGAHPGPFLVGASGVIGARAVLASS